jgi:segregation and condensation protein A
MAYQVALNNFDGPLELLLQLIERSRLTIREIPVSDITDQYIQHVTSLTDIQPAEMSQFVALAARLVHLKSRDLVASKEPPEELLVLEEELDTYQQYRAATQAINRLWESKERGFGRRLPVDQETVYPSNLQLSAILLAYRRLTVRQSPPATQLSAVGQMPLTTVIDELEALLCNNHSSHDYATLQTVLAKQATRQEGAATFLAALELWRRGRINLVQRTQSEIIEIHHA